jgi:Outer membrane protein beta-barrel domain
MRKSGIPAAMMAFAMLAVAGTASAQVSTILKPVQIGVALGGAFPLSDLGKSFNTGFNLTGTIGINPAGLPVGFRIDAAYNQFGAKGTTNVNAKIAGVSGNVVLSMAGAELTPYVIGGVGYYRVSSSATGSVASNNFGFNAGAGLRIPLTGFSTFIEARYNRISESGGSTSFVPVTVGVMF